MPDDFSPELSDLAASQMTHWTPQRTPAPTPDDYRNQAFQAAGGDPYRYAVQSVQDPNNPDRKTAEQFGMQGSIMGGQGATLEELVNLAQAQRSLAAGLHPDAAMELYGWGNWPGVNKMVSEFSDQPAGWNPATEPLLKGSVFRPGEHVTDQLQHFLSHPELFARYQHMEQMPYLYHRASGPLEYNQYPLGAAGPGATNLMAVNRVTRPYSGITPQSPMGLYGKRYEPKWETPAARKEYKEGSGGKSPEISAIIHEAQHAISRNEGFPMGASSTDLGYMRNAGETAARAAQKRASMKPEELRKQGGIVGAIGRETPFSRQGINQAELRFQPHDQPGWPGPAFDLASPEGQRQMMIDYARQSLGRDLRPQQVPGNLLDRLRQAMGQ